jgi:hypothetical protein
MTPTITLELSEYLMLKEENKNLSKSLAEKSIAVYVPASNYLDSSRQFYFLQHDEAVVEMKRHIERYIEEKNKDREQYYQLRQQLDKAKEQMNRLEKKAWWNIF